MTDSLILKIFKIFAIGVTDNTPKGKERLQYNVTSLCHFFLIAGLISSVAIGAIGIKNNGFHNLSFKGAIILLALCACLLVFELFTQVFKMIIKSNEALESKERHNEQLGNIGRKINGARLQILFDPYAIINNSKINNSKIKKFF